MKPDPQQILDDAHKLKTDRFKQRDANLKERAAERFNKTTVDVPPAYQKTSHQHRSQILEDEGRQIGTLVHAMPVPHVPPSKPEDQSLTTQMEQFAVAAHEELEKRNGPVWWQNTLAQTHDNIAWVYSGLRRKPYAGQPSPPENENAAEEAVYSEENDNFKREAGICSVIDYRYVPTATAYPQGNVYDPDRFYEIKEVAERDLMETYGITKNRDGSYSKPVEDATTIPSGYAENAGGSETRVLVIEYWDRDWCMIVAESNKMTWLGRRQVKQATVLEEWEHGRGRVPYFARPAFVTDQLDEDKKFAGPLDPVYGEMPEYKRIATMGSSIMYQTAFSPLQVISQRESDAILDDAGNAITFLDLEPGKARVMNPGAQINVIPQSPEVGNFWKERETAEARIQRYSLSPTAKGISPGADTANAALSNLHRFQLSTLDPMAEQASIQAAAMYRSWFEGIKELGERVYVFDRTTDSYLSLADPDIVSLNIQAKVTPDQGQFQLLIEKHAAELKQLGLITLQEMYEMWGKENPEQYVLELQAEQLGTQLMPIIQQQIISDLGMMDAVKRMIAANQQQGSASSAVPGLMQDLQQANPTGQGQGSQGQPRTEGVRSPAVQTTTQPQMTNGVSPGGY